MPNSLIHENLVRERIQERYRQAQQQRLLARLPRSRFSLTKYLIGRLGTFLVTLETSMQRVEQQSWPVVERRRRDEIPCMKGHDMNLQQEAREQQTMTTETEPKTPEEVLAQQGFTADEIAALLWLMFRQKRTELSHKVAGSEPRKTSSNEKHKSAKLRSKLPFCAFSSCGPFCE